MRTLAAGLMCLGFVTLGVAVSGGEGVETKVRKQLDRTPAPYGIVEIDDRKNAAAPAGAEANRIVLEEKEIPLADKDGPFSKADAKVFENLPPLAAIRIEGNKSIGLCKYSSDQYRVSLIPRSGPDTANANGNDTRLRPRAKVISFTAPWCNPCQEMAAIVSRLEKQGHPIRQVNVDSNHDLVHDQDNDDPGFYSVHRRN